MDLLTLVRLHALATSASTILHLLRPFCLQAPWQLPRPLPPPLPPPLPHSIGRRGIDVIEEQPEKACSPRLVRLAGSSIDVNEEQP